MIERSFSYSKIRSYAICPSRYYWEYVIRILPKDKPKPLAFGYAMSQGLKAYREGKSFEDMCAAFRDGWIEDGKALLFEEDPDNPKDFRTVRRGFELLKDYTSQYPDEPSQVIQPEVKFEKIEVGQIQTLSGDTNIVLNGRLDGVIQTGQDVGIIEDKVVSRLGDTFLPILANSLQILTYLWIADKLGLFQISGKQKTPRCLMNAMRIHPTEFKFKRDIALKLRVVLEHTRLNILDWARQILLAEHLNLFPVNDIDNDACTKYGGCPYLPLKYAPAKDQEVTIANEFRLKKRKNEKVEEIQNNSG